MNENKKQNDFKYLTIALNDHGGYEKSSPKIFENIPTFISDCSSIEQEKVKNFLSSDDLFFVYSVPHNCKHIEKKEPPHVFTKISTPNAQKLASNINVGVNQKALQEQGEPMKEKTKKQLIALLNYFLNAFNSIVNSNSKFFIKKEDIFDNMQISADKNAMNDILKEKIIERNIIFLKQLNDNEISKLPEIKELLIRIKDILEKVNIANIHVCQRGLFLKSIDHINNILYGTIPYYEYIVSRKHSFYKKEDFNDKSNDYFLSPNIDLITTNIGENIGKKKQSFIEVLEYIIQKKEINKKNQQLNSDCSIEILRYFINKIEQRKQYSTSELLIVLYIIYEHYEGNCFITVNANHCRTCINGGKTRCKIRRNKKAKTKKRKTNKKTKKRKTKINRKKSKRKTNKIRNKK